MQWGMYSADVMILNGGGSMHRGLLSSTRMYCWTNNNDDGNNDDDDNSDDDSDDSIDDSDDSNDDNDDSNDDNDDSDDDDDDDDDLVSLYIVPSYHLLWYEHHDVILLSVLLSYWIVLLLPILWILLALLTLARVDETSRRWTGRSYWKCCWTGWRRCL